MVSQRHDDRTHQDSDAVLKLAGGALILFTSYSAARTLALNRLDQRTGRIMEATKMLEEQSNAARAGALGRGAAHPGLTGGPGADLEIPALSALPGEQP
jgi:hypothetical protein